MIYFRRGWCGVIQQNFSRASASQNGGNPVFCYPASSATIRGTRRAAHNNRIANVTGGQAVINRQTAGASPVLLAAETEQKAARHRQVLPEDAPLFSWVM